MNGTRITRGITELYHLRKHNDTRLYNKIRKKKKHWKNVRNISEILQPTLIKNEMKIEKK